MISSLKWRDAHINTGNTALPKPWNVSMLVHIHLGFREQMADSLSSNWMCGKFRMFWWEATGTATKQQREVTVPQNWRMPWRCTGRVERGEAIFIGTPAADNLAVNELLREITNWIYFRLKKLSETGGSRNKSLHPIFLTKRKLSS